MRYELQTKTGERNWYYTVNCYDLEVHKCLAGFLFMLSRDKYYENL